MSIRHSRSTTLMTVHRSNSVYRSFTAFAALIRFSTEGSPIYTNIYPSFAADGRIFHLETLAHSLGDSYVEKEYFLALVSLGRAVFITQVDTVIPRDASEAERLRFANTLRSELLHVLSLQQCVSFTLKRRTFTFFIDHTGTSQLSPLSRLTSSLQKPSASSDLTSRLIVLPGRIVSSKQPISPLYSS